MAAGLSKAKIASRVRYRLTKIRDENYGATYFSPRWSDRKWGHVSCFSAAISRFGVDWEVYYDVSNMSNGETVGLLVVNVWGRDERRSYRNKSVDEAVKAYRDEFPLEGE